MSQLVAQRYRHRRIEFTAGIGGTADMNGRLASANSVENAPTGHKALLLVAMHATDTPRPDILGCDPWPRVSPRAGLSLQRGCNREGEAACRRHDRNGGTARPAS
jgi:hypothetical protein